MNKPQTRTLDWMDLFGLIMKKKKTLNPGPKQDSRPKQNTVSTKSLIDMYSATWKILEYLNDHSPNGKSKVEVRGVYKNMTSFDFVFILHFMHKIMRISDTLGQILQRKSQDILIAITFVSTIKILLQELRECGWEGFLQEVKVFCSRNDIDMPDLDCL